MTDYFKRNIEIWHPIIGYEDLYLISSWGNIKCLNYKRTGKIKNRIPYKDKDGYLFVGLHKDGVSKNYYVHRLVAEAFIPNPDNLPIVNHKSEVKTENFVWNLEWCSVLYNNNYGTRNERLSHSKKKYYKESKHIGQYTLDGNLITNYSSIREAEIKNSYCRGAISHCLIGRTKTAYGYIWKYLD